ncbi:MAG: DUF58 domain-containing protein, partial [Bacilli bacterium]|nr:DUF58 domain-containing protein [Bacilli bacterium]
ARTDKLFVKRYEEETNLRCHIIIDNSSSMYYPLLDKIDLAHPTKIAFSIYAAAAIMLMLYKQRDAVQLSLFSDKIEFTSHAKSSNTHIHYLMSQLERIFALNRPDEEKKTTVTADTLHELAESTHRRSLVVLFTDMFETSSNHQEELFSALQHLRHNKHEVVLFHVVDKQKEIDFDFKNVPSRFIDIETNEEFKLVPAEIREAYRTHQQSFMNELNLRCGQYEIDLVEADINQGFDAILTAFLAKRRKMM